MAWVWPESPSRPKFQVDVVRVVNSCVVSFVLFQFRVSAILQCFCHGRIFDNHVLHLFPKPPSLGNLRIFSSGKAHITDAKLRANTVLCSPAFLIPVTTPHPCLPVTWPRDCQALPDASATCGRIKRGPGTPDPADPLITRTAIIVNAYWVLPICQEIILFKLYEITNIPIL